MFQFPNGNSGLFYVVDVGRVLAGIWMGFNSLTGIQVSSTPLLSFSTNGTLIGFNSLTGIQVSSTRRSRKRRLGWTLTCFNSLTGIQVSSTGQGWAAGVVTNVAFQFPNGNSGLFYGKQRFMARIEHFLVSIP